MKKTNCAKSLYIYDRRMYIDRDLLNLYILRRSLGIIINILYFCFYSFTTFFCIRRYVVEPCKILNGVRHFPRMLIAFFNTSSVSWASRNSRLRRAIPSAHQMHNYQNHEQEYHLIPGSLSDILLMCCIRCQDFLHIHVLRDLCDPDSTGLHQV